MKSRVWIPGLVAVLAFAMVLVGCGGSDGGGAASEAGEPAQTYRFTYNNFFPPTHNNSLLAEMWMDEITQATNGAVEFEYLPGASLTTADKVFDGVLTGISDIGFSCVAYTPGVFPLTELVDMPQGYPSGYVATMAANDFYAKFKPAEFDGVQVFYFYATGPQVVFSVGKPVSTLEDIKGLVLRSTGVGAGIAKLLGAEGYAAAQNEAYELMSKGVIQGSIAPREVLLGWKQAEVVKYVTNSFAIGSCTNMYIVMNKAKFAELPAEIQQVFTNVSAKYVEYSAMVASAYDYDAMAFFREQKGREEINLSDEESARWAEAVRPMIEEAVAGLDAKGLPGSDAEDFLRERIQYWTDNAKPDEECSAWVRDNLSAR